MKKSVLIVTILLLLSLVATSTVAAEVDHKLPKWEQVFDPVPLFGEGEFWITGEEFKNQMYFGSFWTETGDQVWGTKDGKHWSLAWKASDIQEGFEGIWGPMFVFKNQLYLSVGDWEEEYTQRLMRTPDGKHWEEVRRAEREETYSTGFCGYTSFQGAFYIIDCYWSDEQSMMRLWRSTSGDPETWEEVAQFPNWEPAWMGFISFETFKGALYVMSDFIWRDRAAGEYAPAEIWRSFDGVNWEPVITPGFGDETNVRGGSFGQKSGYLYASMGLGDSGGDIYRTRDGLHWEEVTTDGFGDPIVIFSSFVTYRDQIIAYGPTWEEGTFVYASKDGRHWQQINEPGWGDPRNSGPIREYGRVIFKGDLYTATIGPGGVYKLAKP